MYDYQGNHEFEARSGRVPERAFARSHRVYLFRKVSDEGPTNPFTARLFMGVLELRDYALGKKFGAGNIDDARDIFDSCYTPVLNALQTSRAAVRNIGQLLKRHQGKLGDPGIVKRRPNNLELSENIDQPLRSETATFLVNGVIAIKGTQRVVNQFGIDISFLFGKEESFKKGLKSMDSESQLALAKFLWSVRSTWSEEFVARRNLLEHHGWTLQDVKYKVGISGTLELIEPEIDGTPVSIYSANMLNRIISFVENLVVYALNSVVTYPLVLIEIPKPQRDPAMPKRFHLAIKEPGIQPWVIRYRENDFP